MLCNVTLCSRNNIHSVQFSPIYEHIKSHCSQKSPVSSYGTFCQACGREYVCVLRARTEQQWYPTIQCDGRCDFFFFLVSLYKCVPLYLVLQIL